jgi:predicted N-acetyltransferase YhbS
LAITLRNARRDELPAISRLFREAYDEMSSELKPEDRERQLQLVGDVYDRLENGVVIVASDDGELAGTITYYAPGKHGHPRMEYVWAALRILAVAPDHGSAELAVCLLRNACTVPSTTKPERSRCRLVN